MLPSLSLGQRSPQYLSRKPSQVLITANNLKTKEDSCLTYSYTFCANQQFLNNSHLQHCIWVTGDCRSTVTQVREPALKQHDQALVQNEWNKHITEMVLSYFKGQLKPRKSLLKFWNAYLMTAYRHSRFHSKPSFAVNPAVSDWEPCVKTPHAWKQNHAN